MTRTLEQVMSKKQDVLVLSGPFASSACLNREPCCAWAVVMMISRYTHNSPLVSPLPPPPPPPQNGWLAIQRGRCAPRQWNREKGATLLVVERERENKRRMFLARVQHQSDDAAVADHNKEARVCACPDAWTKGVRDDG